MNDKSVWVWIRIPLRAVHAAIDKLKAGSMREHRDARIEKDPSKTAVLRAAADESDEHAESFKTALREAEKRE